MTLNIETSNEAIRNKLPFSVLFVCVNTYSDVYEIELLMFESKKPIFIIIFYQRMKVSPEARRLSKYKEKKKEFSVATLQFDVMICTPIPCAPSLYSRLIVCLAKGY